MPAHSRKLKLLQLKIGADNFECQLRNWVLDPGIPDGETLYTFCPDGAAVDEGEPSPTLQCVFLADWRTTGISRFLWNHNGEQATFQIDHHYDIPAEWVRWTGTIQIKAPAVGGEARATELTELTFKVVGDPLFDDSPA